METGESAMENMVDLVNRIAITGPTGAIGLALIKQCIREEKEVLALVRPGSGRNKRIPDHPLVKVVDADLKDYRRLSDKVNAGNGLTADVFIHLGWAATIGDGRNDMRLQNANVGYALDAVDLAKTLGCHTFIGAGSQAEYGRVDGVLKAETPVFPENGYGMAKLCAGQMTREYCHQLGMKHIWLRILSVYGPGDGDKTMISSVIRKLLAGEKPALTEGKQMWDYLYSEDAARAILLLAQKGIDGKVYPLGSGKAKALSDYVRELRDAIDPQLPIGLGEIPYHPKQVMHLQADLTELTMDTGFVPMTAFADGIKMTIDYLRKH